MAIVYLLAMAVHKDMGFWPSMIPVKNAEGHYKFIKKGKTRNEELVKLFKYMMYGIEVLQWSPEMESVYEVY